jgi:hypothetical protein
VNITNKWKTVRVVVERLNPFKVERRGHGPVDYIPKCLYQARRSGKNGLRGRFVNVLGSGTAREISHTFPLEAETLATWKELDQ